jgi:uncharacterized membrane protein
MTEQNPFSVPDNQNLQPAGTAAGRTVEAGQGIEWLKEGWQLFVRNPGVWIAIAVIVIVIFLVLGFIPLLGHLVANLIAPVIAAGLLAGSRALAQGEELRIEHVFAGFKQNTGSLIVLGVLALVGGLLIAFVSFLIVGGGAMSGAMVGDGRGMGMAAGSLILGVLVMLALMVPLMMALWFAPALVMFRNTAPVEALKLSFNACLKNIMPFLVYGVVMFVLSVVAAIPLGLGFILLLPVAAGSLYASYVDIFERA